MAPDSMFSIWFTEYMTCIVNTMDKRSLNVKWIDSYHKKTLVQLFSSNPIGVVGIKSLLTKTLSKNYF